MSPVAIPYVGFDISKQTLQFEGPCRQSTGQMRNEPAVLVRQLAALRQLHPGLHLICEPTGGYERLLVTTAHALGLPVTLVDAWKVRHFALGLGWLEKNDRIDAAVLRRYALTAAVAPTPPGEPTQELLRDWVQLREHYVARLSEEQVFAQTLRNAEHQRRVLKECARLEKLLAELDAQIVRFLETQAPVLNDKVQTLCLVQGVGLRIATGLLAHLPELGHYTDGAIAKLAGVAPIVDDSGLRSGNKHIARGRAPARRLLYQAALVAARHNDHLQPVYRRLRAAGKPAKVALIAIARRLLLFLNSLLKPAALTPS
jgi:transposase